jgi:hypothetical protein
MTENEQDKTVITLDKTAEELYAAAVSGRAMHGHSVQTGMTIDVILQIEAFKLDTGDTTYRFKMRADASGDALYMTDWLFGSDAVVAVEV